MKSTTKMSLTMVILSLICLIEHPVKASTVALSCIKLQAALAPRSQVPIDGSTANFIAMTNTGYQQLSIVDWTEGYLSGLIEAGVLTKVKINTDQLFESLRRECTKDPTKKIRELIPLVVREFKN